MRDYEDPVHIPPLALKIFTAGLIIAFIVTPIVVTISTGYVGNLLSLLWRGLAAVGYTLGMMFISRLILWFVFAFYWYIAAVMGILLFMLSLAIMGNVTTMPQLVDTISTSPIGNVATVGGVILGLVALYLVFRPGGVNQQVQVPPPVPSTPPPAPTPQKKIIDTAQQIAARKSSLGIDPRGKS